MLICPIRMVKALVVLPKTPGNFNVSLPSPFLLYQKNYIRLSSQG